MFEPGRLVIGGSGTSFDVQDMKSSYIFLASDIQLVMFGVGLRAITLFQLLLRAGRKGSLPDVSTRAGLRECPGGLLGLRNDDEVVRCYTLLHIFMHVPFLADTSTQ